MVADPAAALVGLDFDGTLAPIVADPADSRPQAGAVEVLTRLTTAVGTVAVVTGRPAEVVVGLGGLDSVPGLVVLGHYGLERWAAGRLTAPDPHPGIAAARAAVGRLSLPEGARIEDKGASVAVHTRSAADPAGAFEALREPLHDIADSCGLRLEPGRLVLELRPPGVDKGGALRSLVEERRTSAVVYAGDDLGDLAAFDAVDELREAGTPGLLVASGSDEVTAVVERADLVVEGPGGVVAFLAALADAVEQHRAG